MACLNSINGYVKENFHHCKKDTFLKPLESSLFLLQMLRSQIPQHSIQTCKSLPRYPILYHETMADFLQVYWYFDVIWLSLPLARRKTAYWAEGRSGRYMKKDRGICQLRECRGKFNVFHHMHFSMSPHQHLYNNQSVKTTIYSFLWFPDQAQSFPWGNSLQHNSFYNHNVLSLFFLTFGQSQGSCFQALCSAKLISYGTNFILPCKNMLNSPFKSTYICHTLHNIFALQWKSLWSYIPIIFHNLLIIEMPDGWIWMQPCFALQCWTKPNEHKQIMRGEGSPFVPCS